MELRFREQAPTVARLLSVLQHLLPYLPDSARAHLAEPLRAFEHITAPVEVSAHDAQRACDGIPLAAAEQRAVLDALVRAGDPALPLERLLQRATASVLQQRPAPNARQVLASGHENGPWVVITNEDNGRYGVATVTRAGKSVGHAVEGGYVRAREAAEAMLQTSLLERRCRLKARGRTAWVVQPKVDSAAAQMIDPGSGVVAMCVGDRVSVYFEGNRVGASNLVEYQERVKCAAGRLFLSYATVARASYRFDDFVEQFRVVGTCTDEYVVQLNEPSAGMPAASLSLEASQ